MTDGQGRTVDVKNKVIVMTSNLGSAIVAFGMTITGTIVDIFVYLRWIDALEFITVEWLRSINLYLHNGEGTACRDRSHPANTGP